MQREPIPPYILRQLVVKYGLPEPEIRRMVETLAQRSQRPASVLLHINRDVAIRWWESIRAR